MKNINKHKSNDNTEEENVIRSLGHNALVELLNNNNNEIENECENELHKSEDNVNEINLFEISNCVENESNDKKRNIKCSSTKLLKKFSYNNLNENKIDILNYDNNLNIIKTECLRRNYFHALDRNNIFLSEKSQKLLMDDNIKKNINKNFIKMNNINRNIIYDNDLYKFKKKRKVKSEMLENIIAPKNDIIRIEKKKDLIYFNIEDDENGKEAISENCNNINQTTQNYNMKTSEKKKDNITNNNTKNNIKQNTPKNKNRNVILYDIKKTDLEINDLNNTKKENYLFQNEEKNKKDNKNSIEKGECYDIYNNRGDIFNYKINNFSKKIEPKNYNVNSSITNEDTDKKKNINNDQYIIKKKEKILKSDDANLKKNENNLGLNQEKRKIDKCVIKIEESNLKSSDVHLIKNENYSYSNIDENILKDGCMKKAVNSENFIFLDFNPIEEDYLEIKKTLKIYRKNYNMLYTEKESTDHYSNSRESLKEACTKKEKTNNVNLEQIKNSKSFYMKEKYDDLKETLLKKKINIINYDFENNLCFILIKKSSTL
ncbi:conserved Plasmodium protein, unknown function [Plasmodium gallinaceum]|uniref:Uncharacterized protein n=1 Tax=Plasmodium gallinaceum TaxID=5849 RepID=A0A1J1GVK5_PLAGA|nr:conserved Plasmodium protein, unknown function [Plasmodium gallinaceum]CRG96498.1 conserved Plasmodium protein, unknown function [Plasmodium gallinaceum]